MIMRKNTILSVFAIVMCFLIGYSAYQVTRLVVTLIEDRLAECQSDTGDECTENKENPFSRRSRR